MRGAGGRRVRGDAVLLRCAHIGMCARARNERMSVVCGQAPRHAPVKQAGCLRLRGNAVARRVLHEQEGEGRVMWGGMGGMEWGDGGEMETCNVTSPYWHAVLMRLTLSKAVMLIANQGGTERRLMKLGMSTSSPGRLGRPAETAAWAQEGAACE